MALPSFVADASLYTSSSSYRPAGSQPVTAADMAVVAQHDPCDRPGGGTLPPKDCPPDRPKCCGSVNPQTGKCTHPYGKCIAEHQLCR